MHIGINIIMENNATMKFNVTLELNSTLDLDIMMEHNITIDMNSSTYNFTDRTTTATSTVPKPTKSDYDLARYINFYGLAAILPIGLVCNMLCFVVFMSSKSMRRTTTGHYLIALSVADTIFLIGELSRWLNSFDSKGPILGLDFMDTITIFCHLTFYLRYSGKLVSAWITVVIAVERFITVAYPLKVTRLSTPKIAKVTIIMIYVIFFALDGYPFWTLGIMTYRNVTFCGIVDESAYEIWSMIILRIGSLFLPSILIFTFTVCIVVVLQRAHAQRKQLNQTTSTRVCTMDFQLTIMLISVAITFLLLRLPYTVSYYINHNKSKIWNPLDPWLSYKIYLINKICDMIAITNYAVNFFLYCVVGSAFRNTLCALFRCKKEKRYYASSDRISSCKTSTSRIDERAV